MNKIHEKWVAVDGSIFTVNEFTVKTENKSATTKARASIAFNLKHEIAEHIVNLHNKNLD